MMDLVHRMGNILRGVMVRMWNDDNEGRRWEITEADVILYPDEGSMETALEMDGKMVRFSFPYKSTDGERETMEAWGLAGWRFTAKTSLDVQLEHDKMLVKYMTEFLTDYMREGLMWYAEIDKRLKRKKRYVE